MKNDRFYSFSRQIQTRPGKKGRTGQEWHVIDLSYYHTGVCFSSVEFCRKTNRDDG